MYDKYWPSFVHCSGITVPKSPSLVQLSMLQILDSREEDKNRYFEAIHAFLLETTEVSTSILIISLVFTNFYTVR